MTEIQLRRIVERTKNRDEQRTDGDEFMPEDGRTIGKFSKEAMEIGPMVDEHYWGKVHKVHDMQGKTESSH